MTTDGLDDKEKADLVAKQESPSWKIRRISADKMVVTPKVGAGTVTLSLRPFEGGVLEAVSYTHLDVYKRQFLD